MARIRTYKPEFWSDERTGRLSPEGKCIFLCMMSFADDEGLIRCTPEYIKSICFPYNLHVDSKTVKSELDFMASEELIYRYKRNRQDYAWIIKFRKHQRVDKPQSPTNPPPDPKNKCYQRAVFRRDGYVCALCGEFTDDSDLTLFDETPDDAVRGDLYPVLYRITTGTKIRPDYPSDLSCVCTGCLRKRNSRKVDQEKAKPSTSKHSQGITIQRKDASSTKPIKRKIEKDESIPYETIIGDLNKRTGLSYKPEAPSHRKHIRARWRELKGSDDQKLKMFLHVNDVMTALWNKDDKMKEYLRPSTLYNAKFHDYVGKQEPHSTKDVGQIEQHWRKGNWSVVISYLRDWVEKHGAGTQVAERIKPCLQAYDEGGSPAFREAWNASGVLLEGQRKGERI